MKDPYEILGVSRNSSEQEVKAAYRALAKKYHPDNYTDSPLQELATEKMQEINEAYDAIISGKASSGSGAAYYTESRGNDYGYIRSLVDSGRFDDAEILLENMAPASRDAQWYYLKGQINYRRGWVDQAFTYFSTAYRMEPANQEYRSTYENIANQRSGGFKAERAGRSSSGLSDICCSLLCCDSCCECFGGDLIPCC